MLSLMALSICVSFALELVIINAFLPASRATYNAMHVFPAPGGATRHCDDGDARFSKGNCDSSTDLSFLQSLSLGSPSSNS